MRVLPLLLLLPVLLLTCILAVYRLPLPAALGESRDLVAAVSAGLIGAGYLLGVALYLLGSLRRSARALDPVLEPLGLVGSGYALFGRRYAGRLDGRAVEVRYLPAQAMRAARLDLTVEAELGRRMAVGRRRPLLDRRDYPPLDLGEGISYRVYAQDATEARNWLADPAARAALGRLMGAEGEPVLCLQPDRLWLRIGPRQIVEAEIEGWLRELLRLAVALP